MVKVMVKFLAQLCQVQQRAIGVITSVCLCVCNQWVSAFNFVHVLEKVWKALKNCMVPVVLGAAQTDYAKVLPPDSFLHVENFTSAAQLAEWIKYLDHYPPAYRYLFSNTLSLPLWFSHVIIPCPCQN